MTSATLSEEKERIKKFSLTVHYDSECKTNLSCVFQLTEEKKKREEQVSLHVNLLLSYRFPAQ